MHSRQATHAVMLIYGFLKGEPPGDTCFFSSDIWVLVVWLGGDKHPPGDANQFWFLLVF